MLVLILILILCAILLTWVQKPLFAIVIYAIALLIAITLFILDMTSKVMIQL